MIKKSNNEKVTELAHSLNSIIYKIENDIDIIDETSYNKLLTKIDDMSDRFFSLQLVFSNGSFDIIKFIEELSEENFQGHILIKRIYQTDKNLNRAITLDEIKTKMKNQLENTFFTKDGKQHIKEVFNNCLAILISLYSVHNLEVLAFNIIPYSIASNEQKIYYWLNKYISNELIEFVVEDYLEKYDENVNKNKFQEEDVELISGDDLWLTEYWTEVDAIDDAFRKLEEKDLLEYFYSFCVTISQGKNME